MRMYISKSSLVTKSSVILNVKDLTEKSMPAHKVRKHFLDDALSGEVILLNRNTYASKYDTFFGIKDPDRKPIINLPESDISEPPDIFVQKMEKFTAAIYILKQILPTVLKKYPKLHRSYKEFADGMKLFVEYSKPITDGRWDRSWIEWLQIIEYAEVFGCNAASRKFFAIKDGKRKYIFPAYIKQKIKQKRFKNLKVSAQLIEFLKNMMEIVRGDTELREMYTQSLKEYAENKAQIKSQLYNIGRRIYSHTYYYVRHYDPKMYNKKKSDYKKGIIKKSQITGKTECGPFKEKDFPARVIERLRRREKNKIGRLVRLYSKLVFILHYRPFTILSLVDIVGNETKDTIKLLLEDLRDTGLVKHKYPDNKSEITYGLNENFGALSFDENLYYTIDESNPHVKAMFHQVQEKLHKEGNTKYYEENIRIFP